MNFFDFSEYYGFDIDHVTNAFKSLIDDGFVKDVSVDELVETYKHKRLDRLPMHIAHHVMIALEDIEEEIDSKEEFLKHVEDCGAKISLENDFFPASIGYPEKEGKGHIYIVSPSSTSEKIYTNSTIWVEEYEPVFKVGRTRNLFSRMSFYPPMTKLLFCLEVPQDIIKFERLVLENLQKHPKLKRRTRKHGVLDDVASGNEVFVGNYLDAIPRILEIHKLEFPYMYNEMDLDSYRYLWDKKQDKKL